MNFGEAIQGMKTGRKASRSGWNGRGMYVYLDIRSDPPQWSACGPPPDKREYEPCFVMFTAQGKYQPGWLASQTDMLADDWTLTE